MDVTGAAVTKDLAVDMSPACPGRITALQHQEGEGTRDN